MTHSYNPFTRENGLKNPIDSIENAQQKLDQSKKAFILWKACSIEVRKTFFIALSKQMQDQKLELAHLITAEMGKPIRESIAEIEKCIHLIEWYVSHAASFLKPSEQQAMPPKSAYSFVAFEPLGTILGIMPWNFPFWQVFRFAIPTMLAGNCVLLKHASNVQACAKRMQLLFESAGFASGLFFHTSLASKDIESLISSPIVQGISLTGSEAAGKSVAMLAGKYLKKCVFELGGSDPFIVLPDTDMKACIEQAIKSRLVNNGQSCIAAKRFVIHADCYDLFMKGLANAVAALQIGDPKLETTDLGTMATPTLKEELLKQIDESIASGATIYFKHPFDDSNSNFVSPIILENSLKTAPARKDELFGPVFSCIKVLNTEEAIQIANETNFGLGASIWTKDIAHALQLATQIESGSVFINALVHSDVRIPFGGIKNSGYGRELSIYGMHEFVNVKTVFVGTEY